MSGHTYSPPSRDTVFLVSGGGKGITALGAISLSRAYKCKLLLLGRSRFLEEEPGWAQGILEAPDLKQAALENLKSLGKKPAPKDIEKEVNTILSSREIAETLSEIEKTGGEAEYIQVDITDLEDLKTKLGDRIGGINGILHGAGVLADKLIEDKTEKDLDLVFGVKVGGLTNLLDLIPLDQLEYLVLYSSVAGYYGNAGQTDYSLSNDALNKIAHYVKQNHPDCQVLSIGWGPWDGGMVTPQLKRIFARKKIPLISPEAGTRALTDLLDQPRSEPQVIIGDQLPYPSMPVGDDLYSYQIDRKLILEANPFLADHVIGGSAVLPTVCAVQWLVQSCESIYPAYHFFSVQDYKVFKGIVFDGDHPEDYSLQLRELEKDQDRILFEGIIKSNRDQTLERYHYQAKIELTRHFPTPPVFHDLDLDPAGVIQGSQLYDSKILFHGPHFQGIKRVLNISDSGLTTECQLASPSPRDAGQFPVQTFNPYLADVHLQSLLIWAHQKLGSVGLPLKIAKGVQYRSVPSNTISYATLRVQDHNPRKLVADVISHDAEGNIYAEVSGAEITLTDSLLPLFKQNRLEAEPA